MELVPSSDERSAEPPFWQDERVVGRNRRPMRVPLHAFESAAQALERRLRTREETISDLNSSMLVEEKRGSQLEMQLGNMLEAQNR